MTVSVDRPPVAVEENSPAAESLDPPARTTTADKPGIEDHTVLLLASVAAFTLLVFTAMIVLTALGGGSGYVPWGE